MVKPKRGLTNEEKVEAKAAYEAGASILSLAKKFSVHRSTIRSLRNTEAWTVHPSVQVDKAASLIVQERAQSNVISMATRQAVDRAAKDGTLEALAGQIKNGLTRHAEIEKLLLDVAKLTLEKALKLNGQTLRQGKVSGEAAELKDAIAAAGAAIDKSREIAGLRPGIPSVGDGDGAGRTIEFVPIGERKAAG